MSAPSSQSPRPTWMNMVKTGTNGCPNKKPFLSFLGIKKRFPGVLALDDVSFEIQRGSCHALIGENGAGKSTLGKILAGVYVADAGEILLDGKRVEAPTPLAARRL